MKSAVELNRLFLKFILLCQVKIHKSYCENIAKFTFLGIICESQRFWGVHFIKLSKGLKSKIFWNQGATSGICWASYKPPVLSCSKVGTYVTQTFEPKILIFNFQQEVLKFSDICVSWSSPKTDLRIKFLNSENGSLENISFSY